MTIKTKKPAVQTEASKAVIGKTNFRNSKEGTLHMPAQTLAERWFVIDVEGKIIGRVATTIAKYLMGKDTPTFNPGVDAKTNVIVLNASKIKLTGNKLTDRVYYKHSGYLGGVTSTTPSRILEGKQPTDLMTRTVYGMLPKNKLRHVMMKRLRVFSEAEHPHGGQNPVTINL